MEDPRLRSRGAGSPDPTHGRTKSEHEAHTLVLGEKSLTVLCPYHYGTYT